jgi:hypothetical protein
VVPRPAAHRWLSAFRRRRGAAQSALPRFQTLAFAGELEDRAMMYESVNDRSGSHWIREDIGPIGERKVRCDSDTASLVSTRNNLEE